MAGHSHAKNVMHRKAAQNKKRSKIITKISHAISTAIKVGGSSDPEINPKLRLALKQAQAASVPKDVISRAITTANDKAQGKGLEAIVYEGYLNGIAILIETITDNKNKTAPEIRAIFSKHGGSMSPPGTVAFLFNKVAMIEIETEKNKFDDFFNQAINLEAIDIFDPQENENNKILIQSTFQPEQLHAAQEEIDKNWNIVNAELAYIPQNYLELDEAKTETFNKMMEKLEENESTQAIWHNLKT